MAQRYLNLTKDISLSDSVERLKINLEKLKNLNRIKISELLSYNEEKLKNQNLLNSYNFQISEWNKKVIEFQYRKNKHQQDSEKLITNNIENSNIIDKITDTVQRYRSRLTIIDNSINKMKKETNQIEKESNIEEINNLNIEKKKHRE